MALYEDPSEGASVSVSLLMKPTNQCSGSVPNCSGLDPDPLFRFTDTDP